MCLKFCINSDFKFKKESPKKIYKKLICSTCNNSCYTEHIYLNYLGVTGFCYNCWEDINNFKLDQV